MTGPAIDQRERDRAMHELDTTFLVEAAAGTGKTTLAIARILEAVRTGRAAMEQIAAITFTEKAAGEVKIRLRESMDKLRQQARGEERVRLELGMRQLERSRVNTIHGFCSWLLKERPVEAGVDPGFQVLDALESELLIEETWAEWFHQQMELRPEVLKRALFAEINVDQLRSIAFALVDKRDRLEGVSIEPSPYRVADGVRELGGIVQRLRPRLADCENPEDGACRTVNGLLALTASMKEMPEYRQEYELMHAVRVDKRAGNKANWGDPDSLKAVKDAYDAIKAVPARRAEALLRDLAAWLKGFGGAFARAKALRGVLDFDDLLICTRRLLVENLAVRAEFQRRFQMLLVDEFQDTDPVQAEIVFLLAEERAHATRWDEVRLRPGKLFLVGDPKQSIYRFRRADIEMYEAAKGVVERQGEVLQVRQSFRTASSLLAWVNFTFEQLIRPPEDGGLYQPSYVLLQESPERHTKSPRLCVLEPTAAQRTRIEDGSMEVVRAIEAREVARLIDHLVRSGEWIIPGQEEAAPRPARYGDFAVLLHSPQTSLAAYEAALQQQGIPYQVEGGKDYFQSQEVRAVCAVLLALDDPMNRRELVGVLRSAVFGFSDEEIYLWAKEKPLNYLETSLRRATPVEGARATSAAPSIEDALGLLRRLHEQRNDHSFAGLLELIYSELKLPELFSLKPQGRQRLANLTKLLAVARRIQEAGKLSLREFVDYLRTTALDRSEEGQSPSAESNADVVSLLSVHKAKGLEWHIVVVGDLGAKKQMHHALLQTGCKPGADAVALRLTKDIQTENYEAMQEQERKRQSAEETRLLYVAATRARDYLVLPWFTHHGHYLDRIQGVFDPSHAGETVSMFFRRNGAESRLAGAGDSGPIRVDLEDPSPAQQAELERLLAKRVEWFATHAKRIVVANEGRRRLTPSSLADAGGGAVVRQQGGEEAMEAERARRFGTLMHEVLAEMNFTRMDEAMALWRSRALDLGLGEEDAERAAGMLRTFARTDLCRRIGRADELHREMPFTLRIDDTIVEGVMDLVFRERDQWFLVDYKTDRVEADGVVAHADRYRPQLEAYAKALEAIGGMRAAKILMFLGPAREVRLG